MFNLAANLDHAAPACEGHVLLHSNKSLHHLSKVGRPGAHHLVRVLYSHHEVSGLPFPPHPPSVSGQNREYPPLHRPVPLGELSFSSEYQLGASSQSGEPAQALL